MLAAYSGVVGSSRCFPLISRYFNLIRQFQRLRELKQLGVSYYVYYGATHNRFEHSIGGLYTITSVCHLATLLLKHLRDEQPELAITPRDVKCVQLAALCHDLGHGPFSHLFDAAFMPKAKPGIKFSHEAASEDMLSALVDENDVDISPSELNFIKDLIHGEPV